MERDTSAIARIILAELDAFEGAGFRARRQIRDHNRSTSAAIEQVQRELADQRRDLAAAPFISYVRARGDAGTEYFLISRHYTPDHEPITPGLSFVSYYAPKGALAAYAPGSEVRIAVPRGGQRYEIEQRNSFTSKRQNEKWDAIDNAIDTCESPRVSIASLREFLGQLEEYAVADDATRRTIEEARAQRLSELERRAAQRRRTQRIVNSLQLRDQPVLDQVQDPLFRLPISSRLVLTGAPGTGKTTVMLKRLAQKTSRRFLSVQELIGVPDQNVEALLDPTRAWVLFTPNDLLRSYLKEALGHERLPATDKTVRTWSDERLVLARDVFRFLRVGGRGSLVLDGADSVPSVSTDPAALAAFSEFSRTTRDRLMRTAWGALAAHADGGEMHATAFSNATRAGSPDRDLAIAATATAAATARFSTRLLSERATVDQDENSSPAVLQGLLDDGYEIWEELEGRTADALQLIVTRTEPALRVLGNGLRDPARMRLFDLITDPESLADADDDEIALVDGLRRGTLVSLLDLIKTWDVVATTTKRLVRSVESYLSELPRHFIAFRNKAIAATAASTAAPGSGDRPRRRPISLKELDFLLYALLERTGEIFSEDPSLLWRPSRSATLERLKDRMRTVVSVDEAPDFSSLQLGCMYHLSHPAFRAFTMSGDLMQRTTSDGIRSWDECKHFATDLDVRSLATVYRQNARLLGVAAALYHDTLGVAAPFATPYEDDDDPAPLLAEHVSLQNGVRWAADRIIEIYHCCHRLPSIAIFVPDEQSIGGAASTLTEALREHAIEVDACHGGKVLGVAERVRVFSIDYVKGLEFQGAFLLGVDHYFATRQDLARNYIYVGISRAVMFLGLSAQKLPSELEAIRPHLQTGDWQDIGTLDLDDAP